MTGWLPSATPDEIREACLTRSSVEAQRYLERQGKNARVAQCQTMITRLIVAGERPRLDQVVPSESDFTEANKLQAAKGCKALLRRMLETGQHSLTSLDDVLAAWASIGVYRHD